MHQPPLPSPTRAFTLIELLLVLAMFSVLATITLVSFGHLGRGARLASATNTVSVTLANARALAMKHNQLVLVVFRPRNQSDGTQRVEAVTSTWTGESYLNRTAGRVRIIDRYLAAALVPSRLLPAGIQIAAPAYEADIDIEWVTQSNLHGAEGAADRQRGVVVGVLYGPDGTTRTRNSRTDADRLWLDLDGHGVVVPRIRDDGSDILPAEIPLDFFEQDNPDDEPFVTLAPFLAVYDDTAARASRATTWQADGDYRAELTGERGFISRLADRLHFNRYTGVVMK